MAGWYGWRRRQQYLAIAGRHAMAQKQYLLVADLMAESAIMWRERAAYVRKGFKEKGSELLEPQYVEDLEKIIAREQKFNEDMRAYRQKASDLNRQTAAYHERTARTYSWYASHPWAQLSAVEPPPSEPPSLLDPDPMPEGPLPPGVERPPKR
jgi:hypothetical protein